MNVAIILALSLLFSPSAFAQTGGEIVDSADDMLRLSAVDKRSLSHALLFPAKRRTIVTFEPTYTRESITSRGKVTNNAYQSSYLESRYRFELLQALGRSNWAFSIASAYSSGALSAKVNDTTNVYKHAGFSDIETALRTVVPIGRSNAQYGIAASISPGDQILESGEKESNQLSGGHSLKPFASYETPVPYGNAGATAAYVAHGDRARVLKSSDGREYARDRLMGGNTFETKVFSEYQKLSYAIGALIGFDFVESGKIETNQGIYDNDAMTFFGASLYGNVKISPSLDLAPKLAYRTLLTKDINDRAYSGRDSVSTSVNALVSF